MMIAQKDDDIVTFHLSDSPRSALLRLTWMNAVIFICLFLNACIYSVHNWLIVCFTLSLFIVDSLRILDNYFILLLHEYFDYLLPVVRFCRCYLILPACCVLLANNNNKN